MGLVSSMCKQKKHGYNNDAIVHNNYTQTVNLSSTLSSEKTQCSAISREPMNTLSCRYQYYFPTNQRQIYSTSTTKQMRRYSDIPLLPASFYSPYNSTQNNISYHHSKPYIAQAYSHRPLIHNTIHSRTTSTSDTYRLPVVSDVVQTTGDENQTLTRVESLITTETNEEEEDKQQQQQSVKSNFDDGARMIKRSASAPIDMFLIDISNEHVLVGQPVSMNIRHLLLDTLENHQINSSTPIRIEPTTITTYAHENLLNYIPYVCERYPNLTVQSNQLTRNTLHVRLPSQFSHSLDTLT